MPSTSTSTTLTRTSLARALPGRPFDRAAAVLSQTQTEGPSLVPAGSLDAPESPSREGWVTKRQLAAHLVVPSPRLRAHLELIMQEPRTILFPAVRGGYMTRPNWYVYWNAVRASAGLPKLEFYELKHRALQWMIDPVDDGGLGLDHATAAKMAGHADGGWLIANVYTKLAQRRALDRARRAMSEYAARHPADEGHRPAAAHRSPSSRDAAAKDRRRVAVTAATRITYAENKPTTSVAGWTAGGAVTRRKHAGVNVHVNMCPSSRTQAAPPGC
jgi:hypothetical protein